MNLQRSYHPCKIYKQTFPKLANEDVLGVQDGIIYDLHMHSNQWHTNANQFPKLANEDVLGVQDGIIYDLHMHSNQCHTNANQNISISRSRT